MATPPELLHNDSAIQAITTTLDTPRLSLKDWFRYATIVLIASNVLVFLMMVFRGVSVFNPTADSVLRWGADYGPLTLHGQWWRIVVSTFLHFGLIHLLFNMYVLFNIGLFLESLAGRVPFVVLYLVCGLGGRKPRLASFDCERRRVRRDLRLVWGAAGLPRSPSRLDSRGIIGVTAQRGAHFHRLQSALRAPSRR